LVQKGGINSKASTAGTRVYSFPAGEITRVTRKGDKITYFKCSCSEKYCAHLAAVLFNFQNELLGKLSEEKRTSSNRTPDLFLKYRKLVKQHQEGLIKNKTDERSFLNEINGLLKRKEDSFHITVAIFCGLDPEFSGCNNILEVCRSRLKKALANEPDHNKLHVLQEAALSLVSAPKYFSRGNYLFIIPYVAKYSTDISFIIELRQKLERRKTPQQSFTALDEKMIALNHLLIAEERITGRKIGSADKTAAYYIALAEQYILSNAIRKAVKVLNDGRNNLRKKNPLQFSGYLEKAIELSVLAADHATEAILIKDLYVHELYVKPYYIERIKNLPNPKQELLVNEIISKIKARPESFDRHYYLLISQERFTEAAQLIDLHPNKFRYANELALLMPVVNEKFLAIYIKQFCSAILAAPETHFQKRILQNSLQFLNKLDHDRRIKIMRNILEKLPKHGYVYQQISAQVTANLQA
jgi:hypothetical protein